MINKSKFIILITAIFFAGTATTIAQDGAAIFKQNCAACHKLGSRLVGPDLLGMSDKRTDEWLLKFIKSSQSLIKSGDKDAIAIFEEYNQIVMNDFTQLSDADIKSIITYVKSESTSAPATALAGSEPAAEVKPFEFTAEDALLGRLLYSGEKSFINGGPSCISCHNVNHPDLHAGGLLAKDLTHSHSRMGDAGLAGIMGAPPFPAMAVSYGNAPLDSTEIMQLTAFLKEADTHVDASVTKSADNVFLLGGGGGLIALLLLIGITWKSRLKNSVNHDIRNRQIKSK